MTKAQIVRNNRFNAIQSALNGEMEKVFDWILDAIEKELKKTTSMIWSCILTGMYTLDPLMTQKVKKTMT